jgi:pimeloyl-ACP methyl ester carboxylesterase
MDNAGAFDRILPLMMTPSTKYFCLDFPGHGLTTYCPEWWYDAHVEVMLSIQRIATHFGWEKFSIFGHSMGGIVGFLYAAYFPEHVHRLVAMENLHPLRLLSDDNIKMMRIAFNMVWIVEEKLKMPKKTYTFDQILEKMYNGRLGEVSKEGCLALLKRGAIQVDQDQYQFSYNLRNNIPGQEGRTTPEMSLRLANEVTSPVCFIRADNGNLNETPEDREKFLSVFRANLGDDFEYHEVPGSHHFHLNEPQLIAPIALKFLTK